MTREELDAIRADLKAITQGEWAVETDDRQGKAWVISHDYLCDGLWCENGYCSLADATFIAASPARINDLLEEVERLREALKPFAKAGTILDGWESPEIDEVPIYLAKLSSGPVGSVLTGDFRRARKALEAGDDKS